MKKKEKKNIASSLFERIRDMGFNNANLYLTGYKTFFILIGFNGDKINLKT